MKIIKLFLSVMLVLCTSFAIFSQDVSKIKADHTKQIKRYEGMIKAQQDIIDEHVKMKKDFMKKYWVNEKQSSKQKIAEMEKHCDTITTDAKKLKESYEMMIQFHKNLAGELEKK